MMAGFRALIATCILAAAVHGETVRGPLKATADDVRLVEVEVTLDGGIAASDVEATIQRLSANARGIASSVDPDARRAVIVLPASRVAGLKKEGVVRSAQPVETSSGKYRLQALKPVAMTATPWNSGTYTYDAAANITAIGSDTYTYDGVNRLVTSKTNAVTQNFSYDKFGNRLTADLVSGQCAGASDCALAVTVGSDNRLVSTTKNGVIQYPSYDTAGEITSLSGITFTWDALGMMTSRNDVPYKQFVYDENDERIGTFYDENWTWTLRDTAARVIREYSTGTSPYGNPVWASNAWHWHTDHIYRGDQMLASVANLNPYGGGPGTVTEHFHLDHLGSPRLVTTNGTEVAFHAYFPYGTEQAHAPIESPEETKKFTGHEFDGDNGTFATTYMHARYYSGSTGRFLSVDPVLDQKLAVHNAQAWNRYSYVGNNPMNKVDPDGRLTIIVPGTWAGDADWASKGTPFNQAVSERFGEEAVVFRWSGGNTTNARAQAASVLNSFIHSHLHGNEPLNIVAHSHGGNVVKAYTQLSGSAKIDTLITLGTPQRSDYVINTSKVDTYINVFSNGDKVQTKGDQWWAAAANSAGRTDPAAVNVDVTHADGNPAGVGHSELHTEEVFREVPP
jgi:RHS repeat-associated protein